MLRHGERLTLLIADDDDAIRRLEARVLEAAGFRVLLARDGAEAVELGLSLGHAVDLLITDVNMPHLSGPDAARRLRRARPDLRVVYTSGDPGEALTGDALPPPDAFLPKPFSAEQLLASVRGVMRSS